MWTRRKAHTSRGRNVGSPWGAHIAFRIYLCETVLTMVRYYLVKGRVQGVGFRWHVLRSAGGLGIKGWVRNTDDGHVEVLASGGPEELTGLRGLLEQGSRGSRVDAILEQDLDETEGGKLDTFRIEGAW